MHDLVIRARHWLGQHPISMRYQRPKELIEHIEQVHLEKIMSTHDFTSDKLSRTCSLCTSCPMKFMKSISSVGSKFTSRLAISGGMRYVTAGPVGARIRVKAFRVYQHLSDTDCEGMRGRLPPLG